MVEEEWYGRSVAEPNSSATTSRQHYKILKEEDINHLLQNEISKVCQVLLVPRGVACALLCRKKWSLVCACDHWFAAAYDDDGERKPEPAMNPPSTKQVCKICNDSIRTNMMASAACGHPFCAVCWKKHIATAVSDGAGCLTLQCPESGCRAAVTLDMVEKLASEADVGKYEEYLRRSYVEWSPNRKWCPGAGCGRVVELDFAGMSERYDVVCDCSHKFCWRCGEEWHRPVGCEAAVAWLKRNQSEGANTMWILDNTKPCPRCGSPVERFNNGLFHTPCMTCTPPCSFQFCWICLSPWRDDDEGRCFFCKEHKMEEEEGVDARRMRAKRYRERYIHCYERWDANEGLRRRAMEDLERAKIVRRAAMEDLEGAKIGESSELVLEALEQIVECRHVLKWSYVYAYYLAEEGGKATFLECLQANAEGLQHRLEGKMREGLCCMESRERVKCLISVTRKYLEKLVRAMENDLGEVDNYLVIDQAENDLAEKNVMDEVENNLAKEIEDFVIACKKKEIADQEKEKPAQRSSFLNHKLKSE